MSLDQGRQRAVDTDEGDRGRQRGRQGRDGVGADSLAHFKRPRQLVLRDVPLPRSMSGKILKRELRSDLKDGDLKDGNLKDGSAG